MVEKWQLQDYRTVSQAFVPLPCFLSIPRPAPSHLHPSIPRSLWLQLGCDSPEPISCISCQARIHRWQGGGWGSEISHRPDILTLNLCWWWLPLPSSNPSVGFSLELILLQHERDYDLVSLSLSPPHSHSLAHVLWLLDCRLCASATLSLLQQERSR